MRVEVALVAIALVGCGTRHRDAASARGALGKATGAALVTAIEAAAAVVEPWRCALAGEPGPDAAPPGWTQDGQTLRGGRAGAARIAFVAEARGAANATVATLTALRARLDAAPVDVVVSLGGLGTTEAEIGRALGPLAHDAPWLVVAVPGDRESIADHRAAVAALAASGAPVVDGSAVRLVELPTVAFATLPGAPFPERLGAGVEGCLRDGADAEAAVAGLAGSAGRPHLLVVQEAPRGGSDLAPGGVHAGSVALADAVARAPVDLVVHGAVDDASSRGSLRAPWGTRTATAAVGALDGRYRDDGSRIAPTALVVTVGERELSWEPLAPAVVP